MLPAVRAPARPGSAARRTSVVVRAEQPASVPRSAVPRRGVLALLTAAAAAAAPGAALARDFKAALAAKEARKQKLKSSAGDMKTNKKDVQIFKDSDYAVSEDARTPSLRENDNVKA